MNDCIIRPATINDLHAITEIYNQAILNTVATFDTEPKTLEEQHGWFEEHGEKHPILIGEMDGIIIGWAALSQWSDRPAYAGTAEISLYIQEEFQGKGFGRQLSEAIIEAGLRVGLHTLIARVAEGNEASIALANKFTSSQKVTA